MIEHEEKNLPILSEDARFRRYLDFVSKIQSLTQEDEFLLAKAYLECGDKLAAQKLVKSHLKLVVKIATGYRNYGLQLSELVSEGNVGLMHAVQKFRPSMGFRFSTYARWWIRAFVQEYVLRTWSLVKVSRTVSQKRVFFNLRKLKNRIASVHLREVNCCDLENVAQQLNVSYSDVIEVNMRLTHSDMSLNSVVGDGSSELVEFIASDVNNQDTYLIDKNDRRNLKNALATLNVREREIFVARWFMSATLRSLSVVHNVSKERIRQIEATAFSKIKNFMLNNSNIEACRLD